MGPLQETEDIRRRTAQIQAGLKEARVLNEIRQTEKKEGKARDRADKARRKLSISEAKQSASLDAARKWTFAPVDNPSQRLIQIRFDFSHDGATANAVAVH